MANYRSALEELGSEIAARENDKKTYVSALDELSAKYGNTSQLEKRAEDAARKRNQFSDNLRRQQIQRARQTRENELFGDAAASSAQESGGKFSLGTAAKSAGSALLGGIASVGATGAMLEDIVGGVLDKIFVGAGFKGSGLFNTLYNGDTALAQALGVKGVKTETEENNRLAAENAANIRTGNERADKVLQKAATVGNELAYGVGYALPMAVMPALGAAQAGTGLAAVGNDGLIAKGAQVVEKTGLLNTLGDAGRKLLTSKDYWTSFAQEVGSDYYEALEDGASDDQAATYAIATALVNSVIEIGGGIQDTTSPLWKSALEEGQEEIEQGPIQRLMKNVVYNKGNPMLSTTDEDAVINPGVMAKEFSMGAAVGGILAGGQRIAGNALQKAAENSAYRNVYGENAGALADEAIALGNDNATAQRVKEKVARGERVSVRDIRDLVNMDEDAIHSAEEEAAPDLRTQIMKQGAATDGPLQYKVQPAGDGKYYGSVTTDGTTAVDKAMMWRPYVYDTGGYDSAEQAVDDMLQHTQKPSDTQQAAPDAGTESRNGIPVPREKEASAALREAQQTPEAETAPATLEEHAKQYGPQAQAFIHTYNEGQDVEDFARAYGYAYDYGRSGVPYDTVDGLESVAYLTEAQREIAYETGAHAAAESANVRQARNAAAANGKTGRRKGTVRGEGVTIADMKATFNDQQGRAYRAISAVAEATGVDVVLYRSEQDENGAFQGAQGRFSWKDDTVYIDINSGLLRGADVPDVAKYAMLRTFGHEFTHFIEKWSPVQYTEFRKAVFSQMERNGENVNDLIERKMEETGLPYEKASREVVAEAMTDILPDSSFVQTMAQENKSLLRQLVERLKAFAEDVRDYFASIGANRSREAAALKETVDGVTRYVQSIVEMYDKAAAGAVESYQRANAVEEVREAPAKEKPAEAKQTAVNEPKEIDVTALLGGITKAQGEANRTGKPQAVKVSDYEKKPEAPKRRKNTELDLPVVEFNPGGAKTVFQTAEDGVVTKTDKDYRYKTIDGVVSGSDVYFRFRGAPKGAAQKQVYAVVRDYRLYTANEVINDVLQRSTGSGAYPLGRHFNDVVREIWRKEGLQQGFVESALRDLDSAAPTQAETVKEEQTYGKETGGQEAGSPALRADHEGGLPSSDADGEGNARLLDGEQEADVQRAGGQREVAAPAEERGGETGGDDRGVDSADRDRRSEGDGESGNLRRDGSELTETEKAEKDEALHETVQQQTEEQSTEHPRGKNYAIGDSLDLPKGEKARFRANVDAIRLVKQLVAEGRYATEEEQQVLSRYVGWGGLSSAFGELAWNRETRKSEMQAKSGWENEFAELRQLVEDSVITEDEYKAMSGSTKNAHYTSVEVIRAMYDGLEQLGFQGGRMLEPSAGVGNFVGAMPAAMTGKVNSWTMVELDTVTGQIAKYLYPYADMRIQGFETANLPDNFMDVAIGNVPFGNYGVVDRAYPKRVTKAIHNYFFAKSLDKVRPGGIVMFITSSFTMNAQDTALRQYIMDRADLLGAIRLPNNAFSGNAGTEVVTDILVLKKREKGAPYGGEAFLDAPYQQITDRSWETANVNEYFTTHPEMVLGTAKLARGMYGANSLTYDPLEGRGTLGDQIREAFRHIDGKMDYTQRVTPEKGNAAVEKSHRATKRGGLEVGKDGKLYQNDNGALREIEADADTVERVSGLLGIRDKYRALTDALQQGQDAKTVKRARTELNKAYDAFVKQHGYINDAKNKKALLEDPDRYSLFSLENYDPKAPKGTPKATKADIFTKDTVSANKTVHHVDDLAAGVIVSVNYKGRIDTAYIAQLTGKTEETVRRELIDGRMAFKTRDGNLAAPETYLSGNVRAKLREAEALAPMDKDFQNNVEALRRVIPADIPFNEIYASVGTPWVPNSVYADFVAEMLGGRNVEGGYAGPDVTVSRTNTGEFKITVNNKRLKGRYQNTQEWGTARRSFLDIVNAMMNSGSLTVNDYIEDANGKRKPVTNKVETAAVQAKAEEIGKAFTEWLWKDETRRKELGTLYNETFNALLPPKYSGEHLTVNGLNAEFTLKAHQADAVQRIVSSGGNTLLAHRVGAGKTLEMATAAMKLRELGIVKKPMFVVPKSLVAQWGVEFKSYFPAARLLVSDEKSFSKENRRTFANQIANSDFDAVILSYEQFEKIPVSLEYRKQFYQQQIDDIIDAIAEEKAESGSKSMTVKEMEKRRAQLEKKIQELTSKAKDEDNIDFEKLGVDSLFVDEAHNFKNLQYVTRMHNVSGLGNSDGSQRAFDLYTKVRYLQELNGGRGVVFATATPVMNSMAEMYIMQKYLQSDMLDQLGLKTFDAWAKQFGEVVNSVEIKPSGQGFRVKQTFSKFRNLNELQMLFRSFSDVLTRVPDLKIPKMRSGKVITVECEPGQFQKDYMVDLEKRADNVKNVDPSVDNMLKITSDGRKVSYTQRMIDPTLPYEPGCKLYACCDNVLKEYKASKKALGTQIVFCDMATPKGKSNTKEAANADVDDTPLDTDSARLYEDMKAYLVKRGIPAKEIAFIHDADTDAKKKQLFADVNDGKVRVLIGSTGKMGVGMNAQKRIVAIHHLDAPWRPGDVEQRDGRAFRQKNMNDEVAKYVYVTKGSFDARLWDILDRKQGFINQIMNGDNVGRSAEDTGDVTLSAAEVKAIASDNPLIMEQVQLTNELQQLQDLKRAHDSAVVKAQAKALSDEQRIKTLETEIAKAKTDIRNRVDTYSEGKFSMTVGNATYTEKKDAGTALAAAITAKAKPETFTDVGTFAGFTLRAMKEGAEYRGLVSGAQGYKFNVYPENTTYMVNHIIGVVEGLEHKVEAWNGALSETRADLKAQEKMMAEPFAKQAEMEQKTARFNEIMAILSPKEEQTIGDEEETQYQQRTSPLSDREVLSIATSEVDVDGLTDGEKDALRIWQERLENLNELTEKRAEEGRKYKEQMFTKGGDRSEAAATHNRMEVLDQQIQNANASLLDVESKEVLRRVLKKARTVVEVEERKHGNEKLARWRARRNEAQQIAKYRTRVQADVNTLTKWILHPDNKNALQHVPDVLKESVIPFLSSINFTSKRQLRGGDATKADAVFVKSLENLRSAIKTNIDVQGLYSGYNDLPEGFMDEMQQFIDAARLLTNKGNGEYVINRMTAEELRELSRLVRVVKKLITEANVFHQNAMFRHVYEAGNDSIWHMGGMSDAGNTGIVSDFLLWQQIRPAYAFERFGKGGVAIYDELRRGQAELAFHTQEIKAFAEKTYTEEEVRRWEKETKTFTLGEDTVTVPVSYLMGLYELSKRPQALGHLLGAGLRVATYKNGKEKISDTGHALTPQDITEMVAELTPRQIEVADALQQYMAKQGGEWGNHVSVARFGEEMFGEEHYYPIHSDGRHLQSTADEHPGAASLYALLNMSFTKELKENASNRVILYSIFDVFANHMASMAQYNAFALPILDSLRWFNYQFKDADGNVMSSVREQMARVYGVPEETRPGSGRRGYAENFVMNIIKAFNGTETQGVPTDTQGINALHRYNVAQVAYNFRVVVQQPLAITRAGMLLDYRNILRGLKLTPSAIRKNIEEMEAHSGIAAWKSLGFYDVNISRGLTDIIKHSESTMDKIDEIGMAGAELADRVTWAAMWSACKEQVKRRGKYTEASEEYFGAVTDLFEDVVYKTQVVDSVLTKNEFLRSKGVWARLIGSFMSEPTTTASMLIDAYDKYSRDLQSGKSRRQAWEANRRNIVRTAYVYAIGDILLAAVTAVMDAWRKDDDYKTFLQKWLDAFGGNLLDEAMPLNKLPILRDVYELIKKLLKTWGVDTYGNNPRSIIFQWSDYLVKGSEIIHDHITGKDTNYTWYGGAYKLLQAASGMTGLPMAAATREVVSAWNNTVGAMAPSLRVKSYDRGSKSSIRYGVADGYLTKDEAAEELLKRGVTDDRAEAEKLATQWSALKKFDTKGRHKDISGSAAAKYEQYCEGLDISTDTFYDAWKAVNSAKGEDRDGDGRADTGTVVKEKLAYIATMQLTNRQKRALAEALGVSAESIKKYTRW